MSEIYIHQHDEYKSNRSCDDKNTQAVLFLHGLIAAQVRPRSKGLNLPAQLSETPMPAQQTMRLW